MKNAVIIDIDGTLADISHRKKFLTPTLGMKKDWKSFFEAMSLDSPNTWCFILAQAMYQAQNAIIFITGREELYRETTIQWIRNMFERYSYYFEYQLFMRNSNDFRADYIIKKELYTQHIQKKWHILFVVEDRKKVVDCGGHLILRVYNAMREISNTHCKVTNIMSNVLCFYR